MKEFYDNLKKIFEDIPNKTKFLKDMGLNSSYSGFRYFMHGRREEPTANLLATISNELDYEYIQVPIPRGEAGEELKKELQDNFLKDLKIYSERYSGDKARVYVKDMQGSSVHQMFTEQMNEPKIELDEDIQVTDLF